MYAQRRDKTEQNIINFYAGIGAYYKKMDKEDGFDMLVVFRGQVYITENKNSGKYKLTQRERDTCFGVEEKGHGTYHIIQSVEDAQRMLGLK